MLIISFLLYLLKFVDKSVNDISITTFYKLLKKFILFNTKNELN